MSNYSGCNDCNSCNNCNKCNTTCGCKIQLSANCVKYEGEDTLCTNIKKGDRLEAILPKLDFAFCQLQASVSNTSAGQDGADGADGTLLMLIIYYLHMMMMYRFLLLTLIDLI